MITHKKKFGIYHWDTFDNEVILIGEEDTVAEATTFIKDRYNQRISTNGADYVEIVDQLGTIVSRFGVT